jgi:uncharacterized membrane protein/DNA-binding transcriptional regulator YiaG
MSKEPFSHQGEAWAITGRLVGHRKQEKKNKEEKPMPRADRLKEERMQRGWSQARVAELIGTDPGNVSRWERGRSSPSPYFRERLCQLYAKNAQELGLWIEEPAEKREETPCGDPGELKVWVGEPVSFDTLEERQAKAAPATADRVFACLSYALGWLTGVLVLLFHRSSRFTLFHSLQSICFFGGIHLIVVLCTVTAPFTDHNTVLTLLRDVCGPLAVLFGLIGWCVGLIQAARGKDYPLPLVGRWCQRLAQILLPAPHEEPILRQTS